jgi:hypothetical protein
MILKTALLALLPLILTIISFAFTVLTTVSKDWAHQNHFDGTLATSNWTTPLYTLWRSPFYVCSPSAVYTNGTAASNSTINQTKNSINSVNLSLKNELKDLIWTVNCARFPPKGFAKTSCESNVKTNISAADARFGDDRQCQQIHMAGGLAIAASVFVGIALLAMLVLCGFALAASPNATATSALSITVIILLLLGAGTMFIAQFYGVLGLVQSALPNGNFAADGRRPSAAGPWVQGKASVIYGSVGWFGAVCAAGVVTAVFGMGRGIGATAASTGTSSSGGLWSKKGGRVESREY